MLVGTIIFIHIYFAYLVSFFYKTINNSMQKYIK